MKKLHTKQWIAVVVAVAVVGFFFVYGPFVVSLFTSSSSPSQQLMQDSLQVQDTVLGAGDQALPGTRITVNYVGHFADGQIFDSSIARHEPFQFVLGTGTVIEGWDKGIVGMRVGGKRTLVVPPSMGYGAQAVGPIPANSTLIFDVELLKVEK